MAEQRLIDSNADVYPYVTTWTCNCSEYGVQNVMAVDDISTLTEIDPETLPFVQQLRAELKRVMAERDEYKELFFSYKHVCGGIDPQRIGELVEADKAGRCVVIPCKPMDTAYQIVGREVVPFPIGNILVEDWGLAFEGHLEGFGPYRTGPDEKVFFDEKEAKAALSEILAKEGQ